MRMHTLLIAFVLTFAGRPALAEEPALWVYCSVNFQVEKSTTDLIALLKRAKAAGYTAAVVTDYKFGKLDDRPDHYYKNLERTRLAAAELGLELIPCVAPIGYSNSILWNNPNLAEGIPMKDCPMIVRDGKATVANESNLLTGGAFENAEKQRPTGWDWCDGFGSTSALDTEVKHAGKSSLRIGDFKKGNENGNGRIARKIALRPFTEYRATLWIKTKDLEGGGELKVNVLPIDAPRRSSLSYQNLGAKRTQDWTKHTVVFNSLEASSANFYIGIWSGSTGTFWIDDVELREAPGVNMVRRADCPVRLTDETGRIEYVEGRDFETWTDPKSGTVPYAGAYITDQAPPAIVLTKESRIKESQKLLASCWHTVLVYDEQVCCTLINEELFKHVAAQARLVEKYLKPKRYFMQHDELRVAGWNAFDAKRDTTAGKLLAENARRCIAAIRETNPKAGIMVWSDMFDPHHNAVDKYYLVATSLAGSWEGLSQDVLIVNWNSGKAEKSLGFFADRGHRQVIAGYYDNRGVAADAKRWKSAVKGAAIEAYMYTTWRNDYRDLEAWAKAMRE